ncbi:flagellar hook-basal body complex protein [Algicella marina]|uniref:Flagellar basal-body rod protein FlgF n=1 Tax=Algicella marina TaxID=2683284 RepID=A0A6P1T595_9RHOB|nr:flagellar hook-basal body complex protein [Algicella marina]QHQ36449.1 flagellar hook-basal body complex protein [Algicella marina]
MDTPGYVALSRQSGLLREMQAVANNIANSSTSGFRREGVIFAEMISAVPVEGGSVAMTTTRARFTSDAQGGLQRTGGTFDLAIEGEGFFMVETPAGMRLTRAGSYGPNVDGELVNPLGHRLLDDGEAPIFIPPDARTIAIAADGTISADGNPAARLGVVRSTDTTALYREDGVLFRPEAPVEAATDAAVLQGFIEKSNVNPVIELTRMIEVQRNYELGQKLMEREDERIRAVTRTLGQASP